MGADRGAQRAEAVAKVGAATSPVVVPPLSPLARELGLGAYAASPPSLSVLLSRHGCQCDSFSVKKLFSSDEVLGAKQGRREPGEDMGPTPSSPPHMQSA